ncbi:Ig-like domain-containing protein [Ligilactobacillus aviarius]|uniref:Ig-like domain-containing protein n=1 Tax=Ligilactobacillus aviarius TaxID=1606 RepID=UPI0024BBA1B5|nr:Ig-like domain-containing protein [Ligilactobacillus aviarius]
MKGLRRHKVICSLVIAIASVFLFCFNANAATIKVNGLDASQATVKGLQVSGAVSNIQYSWSIPDNENVADGDTAVFTLPNGFEILQGFQGSVKAVDGTVVGTAVINANSSTGTIKFNGTLTGKTQRQGTLQLWACKNRPSNTYQVSSPSLGPVTKFGRVVEDGLGVRGAVIPQGSKATNFATPSAAYNMTWYVLINPSGKSLKNVVITDHGSDTDFEIHAYQATVNGTTISGTNGIPCTPRQDYDTHTLTVNLGDINTPVLLTYYSSHFKTDTADIDTFNNEATVTSNGTVLGSTNAEVGWGITGTASYSNKPYVSSSNSSSSSSSKSISNSSSKSSSSSESLSSISSSKGLMSSSEISSSLSKNSGSLGNPSSSLVKNSMNLHGGTNNKSVTKPSNHSSKGHLPQTGELTSIVAATIGVILIAVGVYSVKKMK